MILAAPLFFFNRLGLVAEMEELRFAAGGRLAGRRAGGWRDRNLLLHHLADHAGARDGFLNRHALLHCPGGLVRNLLRFHAGVILDLLLGDALIGGHVAGFFLLDLFENRDLASDRLGLANPFGFALGDLDPRRARNPNLDGLGLWAWRLASRFAFAGIAFAKLVKAFAH